MNLTGNRSRGKEVIERPGTSRKEGILEPVIGVIDGHG
jgi:hypothetical protein